MVRPSSVAEIVYTSNITNSHHRIYLCNADHSFERGSRKSRKEKEELDRRIAELKRLADPQALEPLRKQRDDLKAQLEVKRQELELVVGEIPSAKDVSTIYKKLGAIASKTGVRLLSVNLAKPNEVNYTLKNSRRESGS